ncbi:TPA: collagen-like protein, partial [Streptococcus pyogenes]|nr:collagen-like protein [Streptococcus pyogenes]HER6125730.1 collagen-like protein [Streptococcus pyogenes]HER6129159.1 collagen-like protein [Streptococcus pyogenes]
MLTSKHHNINKLVWRYGLTSAAAVLLAFGGGASSVKADDNDQAQQQKERSQKIQEIKSYIETKYPRTTDRRYWDNSNGIFGSSAFDNDLYQKDLDEFTQKALTGIVELVDKAG